MRINTDFATKVLLEYHYVGIDIAVEITEESDIQTLRQILNGRSFWDNPACGFTTDISITMANDNKSIVFCPACDGCPLLLISNTGKYIRTSDEDRTQLNEVLGKYGITFPCV